MEKKNFRITFNSPVILIFVMMCLASLIISMITNGQSNMLLFSVYRCRLNNPFAFIRFFGHIIGHANWSHFLGNMTYILLVGPLLEEKYGSKTLLEIIAITAFVTGLIHFILFPSVQLLGASGVVFAMILLSSITSIEDGSIPLTFIIVAIVYIGTQVYDGVFVQDNVANLTHIIGGVVGTLLGFALNKDVKKIESNQI